MSWMDEAKVAALAVKAGQWTSYHVELLADHVLKFCHLHEDPVAAPVAPVAPAPVEVHVEGAEAPKEAGEAR